MFVCFSYLHYGTIYLIAMKHSEVVYLSLGKISGILPLPSQGEGG